MTLVQLFAVFGAGRYLGRIDALHFEPALSITLASLNVVIGACYALLFCVWTFMPDVAYRARGRLVGPFIAATVIQGTAQMVDFTTLFVGVYYLKALVQGALAGVLSVIAFHMVVEAVEHGTGRK